MNLGCPDWTVKAPDWITVVLNAKLNNISLCLILVSVSLQQIGDQIYIVAIIQNGIPLDWKKKNFFSKFYSCFFFFLIL